MITKRSKISIIGAGFVGASAAYALAVKGLASEIVLIDANAEKAEGEAMDIAHGLSFMGEMRIRSGGYELVRNSDIIIVTAGANRKPGETRLELAQKNVGIAKSITKSIMEHYNTGVIMVVANPVDVLTYVIQKESGLPAGRVFGTGTVLDTTRFCYELSEVLGVDVRNIHGSIIGEHGDSHFPMWSAVHLAGMKLDSYCEANDVVLDKEKIEIQVKTSGAEVIKRKGATYYAIASVISKIAEVVMRDQHAVLNVSTVMDGPFGLHDVSLSLPSIVGRSGVIRTIEPDLTTDEQEKLIKSSDAIKEIIASIA